MAAPIEPEIRQGYRLLGHENGLTELFAKSRHYKSGKENVDHNRKYDAFPKHWYAQEEDTVVSFVLKFHENHTVMYGINPRYEIFRNERGFVRSARDGEIRVSQNLLLDYDFKDKNPSEAQRSELISYLLTEVRDYFFDLGLEAPPVIDSGRGANLLVCYEPIAVQHVPDIVARLRKFASEVSDDHKDAFERFEVKQDNTQDLGRYLRVIATAKPEVGITSKVYGGSRVEDKGFREYLLNMEFSTVHQSIARGTGGGLELAIGSELPSSFQMLLEKDRRLEELYAGQGKIDGSDVSGSGYDYSLVRRMLQLGYTDVQEIASVLAVRPNGSVQNSGKGEEYIRRTIANALIK